MKKLQAIAIISIVGVIIGFGCAFWVNSIINNPIELFEPDDPPDEPDDPYIKGWSILEEIIFISGNDYFFVNYTIPPNYTYRCLIVNVDACAPNVYAIPPSMFEAFCEAVEEGYVHNNPIVDSVYQFEPFDNYNIYGNYISPNIDNWYIFYCAGQGGRTSFNFADAIFDRIIID